MPNDLTPPFQFSQSSLQDYRTCARRFALRYLRQVNWPAVETAPIQEAERRMQLGSDFHRLTHQHNIGMLEPDLAKLVQGNDSPELAEMWAAYLSYRPAELAHSEVRLYPEISLFTVIRGHRLNAKFDLLAFLPDKILIIDWKTAPKRPASSTLRDRAQSRVYPYLLCQAGASLNQNHPIDPAQVQMIYWFAHHPHNPEFIDYSQHQLDTDEAILNGLIAQIEADSAFSLTRDENACRFCVYRSYCERGKFAADFSELDDDLDFEGLDLDWEQVSEIAY